jgi:Cys-tRNA(Pro)/Cys-tRNA(Cys) deacylase
MSHPAKTLAMRVLEAQGVAYEAVYYEVQEHLSAGEVARTVGLPPEQVFKTLVALPETPPGRPVLALVPADQALDLKSLAAAAGVKKLRMAPHKEAERLTGLHKGGISALALLDKGWPVFLDETAILFDRIWVSAGKVGAGVILGVDDLVRVLGARLAELGTG